jgi:glycosyltransferase involved in cell wall biosynthesis
MRILVLSNLYPPDFIGGYELACSQVVDALRRHGHDVLVLTSAPRIPVPPASHVRRTLKLTDVYNIHCLERMAPVTHLLYQAEANFINAHNVHGLTTALEEFRPDAAYVWNINGLGGLGLIGCLQHLRVPWVWHLMDRVPVDLCRYGGRVIAALAREFERRVQGHYLVCSSRLLKAIETTGVRLSGQVEVLPNWIQGRPLPPRTRYFQGKHLRILSAGQLGRHKGIDLIIQLAARLWHDGHRNFSVDLYGKTADASFQRLIHQLKVDDCVRLCGSRTQAELSTLYGHYDVFAFPTWEREPFAFAPLEAAAQGCVPVMSRLCGNAEWFVDGVHCLKADRSVEGFRPVFANILTGKIDLEPIGRRASAVIRRDFHLDQLFPRIERLLVRAAGQPRTGAGTSAEAYRLALLAEKLTQVLVQEPFCTR